MLAVVAEEAKGLQCQNNQVASSRDAGDQQWTNSDAGSGTGTGTGTSSDRSTTDITTNTDFSSACDNEFYNFLALADTSYTSDQYTIGGAPNIILEPSPMRQQDTVWKPAYLAGNSPQQKGSHIHNTANTTDGVLLPACTLLQQLRTPDLTPEAIHPNSPRYPVLEPIIHYLRTIMPLDSACELLECYFLSTSSAETHPLSPYILSFLFRKKALLHPTWPRRCQPALLASILWVAAQSSDCTILTASSTARAEICQQLLSLTLQLVEERVPFSAVNLAFPAALNDTNHAGRGVTVGRMAEIAGVDTRERTCGSSAEADCQVDIIATYIHLATVTSAKEHKGHSINWWNIACSMARKHKLNKEASPNGPRQVNDGTSHAFNGLSEQLIPSHHVGAITEEQREERRRVWWLLYIVDRNMALSYNRPLYLRDAECSDLLLPMDDAAWQNGEFSSNSTTRQAFGSPAQFQCRGSGIFGSFLPLMIILGEIVELHHAKQHPRFAAEWHTAQLWEQRTSDIRQHIQIYELSLHKTSFEVPTQADQNQWSILCGENEQHYGSYTGGSFLTQELCSSPLASQQSDDGPCGQIPAAYGMCIMHTLHVLLECKWDPIELFEEDDGWIFSQSFLTASGHALSAADRIGQILQLDPSLEFMPFFFGIYLLQGSFLPLLIADKLPVQTTSSLETACENIVRAHEACIVTLDAEYQRHFRKVMRSALGVIRERRSGGCTEQYRIQRELLKLYRWTGDGTGLAL